MNARTKNVILFLKYVALLRTLKHCSFHCAGGLCYNKKQSRGNSLCVPHKMRLDGATHRRFSIATINYAAWQRFRLRRSSKHRFDDIYVIIKSKSVYTVLLLPWNQFWYLWKNGTTYNEKRDIPRLFRRLFSLTFSGDGTICHRNIEWWGFAPYWRIGNF